MMANLAPKNDPVRRCRPFQRWPGTHQQAWLAAIKPGDRLEPGGAGADWAPITRIGIIKSYGRWLNWLDREGRLDPSLSIAKAVTPDEVKAFLKALQPVNAPKTVVFRAVCLAQAVSAMAPVENWAWLWRIVGRLQRAAVPMRPKRTKLVDTDELLALGRDIMARAEKGREPPWRRAVDYRDGLLIALLAMRPLRIKNLAAIEMGRHLTADGDGYTLRFLRSETKNRTALELPFPHALVSSLHRYLAHYRPVLQDRVRFQANPTSRPGATLWLTKCGAAMTPRAIYERIILRTRLHFGQSINPHLFRDCAATTIATRDPHHVRITTSVLGHRRMASSERAYNHAQSLDAVRHYQKRILALRRAGAT